MRIGEHDEPLLIHRLFEGFIPGPHDHFYDVVDRPASRVHHLADVSEHEFALVFDIRRSFSRFGFHAKDSAAHHEGTDGTAHGDRIIVLKSGNLKTASTHDVSAPWKRSITLVDSGSAPLP